MLLIDSALLLHSTTLKRTRLFQISTDAANQFVEITMWMLCSPPPGPLRIAAIANINDNRIPHQPPLIILSIGHVCL
jgi:hypothetical protein